MLLQSCALLRGAEQLAARAKAAVGESKSTRQ